MGLHSIIGPAGTLMTGWALVPAQRRALTDRRDKDRAGEPAPAPEDRTLPPVTRSKWECPEPPANPRRTSAAKRTSDGKLGKVGQRGVTQAPPHL